MCNFRRRPRRYSFDNRRINCKKHHRPQNARGRFSFPFHFVFYIEKRLAFFYTLCYNYVITNLQIRAGRYETMLERLKKFFIKFFTKVGDIFQFASHIFSLFSQLFVTAFLIYAVLTKPANRVVNAILLALAVGYFIFGVYIAIDGYSQKDRKIKMHVARSYKIVKRLFKLYTLGVAVYGIYQHLNTVTISSFIFTALMVISFIVQVTLEINVFIIKLLLKKLIKNRREKRAAANALKESEKALPETTETEFETELETAAAAETDLEPNTPNENYTEEPTA